MDNDFIIRRAGEHWRVVALSDRGKAFADADPRFERGEAILAPEEARALHDRLTRSLLFSSLPDGLPPAAADGFVMRVLLLLALILVPAFLFAWFH